MPDTLFSLEQLGLTLRARPVLRGLHWDWEPGQHWALLGPNGAGKTALATVLSGEQQHFSGHYRRGPALNQSGIAYVCFERGRRLCERDRKLDCAEFESAAVDTGTRVSDLLGAGASDPEGQAIIELLGLRPILARGLRYISTGEMRKALLASALIQRPALLILDSPLDGLDRQMQAQLGAALERIIPDSMATLLLCRSVAEIPRACTHIMLLDRGRMLRSGPRADLIGEETTRELLAAPPLRLTAVPECAAPTANRQSPGDRDPAPALRLRTVSASFGEHCVFRELDWTLRRDQHCLLSGPNGCGKSTLLDLLTGDNHKAYGQDVSLFGRRRGSGESVWEIKALFGRVDARLQFSVPAGSTVFDTVCSGFFDSVGLYDMPGDGQKTTARQWLAALDLSPQSGEEFQSLSFGLQRLVLLARAMVKAPPLLLLDEATLGLDDAHRRLLLAAVDHVIEQSASQLLFVSHSAGEVPRCINQELRFQPYRQGSRVKVIDHRPAP